MMDQPREQQHLGSQPHNVPPAIREACEKLHKISRDVRILGRLHGKRSKLVSSAVRIMTSAQTARPFKIYQSFLFDVLRAAGSAGPAMVILCSASLGKDKIVQFNAESRTALIDYITCHKNSLNAPVLSSLVVDYNIPGNQRPRERENDERELTIVMDFDLHLLI